MSSQLVLMVINVKIINVNQHTLMSKIKPRPGYAGAGFVLPHTKTYLLFMVLLAQLDFFDFAELVPAIIHGFQNDL